MAHDQVAARASSPSASAVPTSGGTALSEAPSGARSPLARRQVSLDVYRGLIMALLAAQGFGLAALASLPPEAPVWEYLDRETWQDIGFHFRHMPWITRYDMWKVAFWDLIQPAFMFMVGVAMPFSYARREAVGHSPTRRFLHALWRGFVLVLLGVFLRSLGHPTTHWVFIDVLAQIGLGYVILYGLTVAGRWAQGIGFVVILVGYYLLFLAYTPPPDYDYEAVAASQARGEILAGRFVHWSKNANIGYRFDLWFLHQFPRPPGETMISHHRGGYVTLNFIPSIATMLLGVFCGQILRSSRGNFMKWLILTAFGGVLLALGIAAGEFVCPVVKRIWTPSWVLFSGGWVVLGLAGVYFLFDVLPLRWLGFPLAIIGMNSLVMYLMGWLIRGFTIENIHRHFQGLLEWGFGAERLADDMFGRVIDPTAAFVVFWLIVLWMYRQRFFVRV